MKYIKKVSTSKISQINGSVVDTFDIADKITNAPSVRVVIEALHEFQAQTLLASHPIGSLYWSEDSTEPSELFGGTWERVKDKFIYALGDSGSAGETGGSATHTHTNPTTGSTKLTVNQIPSHTHTFTGTAASHNHTQINGGQAISWLVTSDRVNADGVGFVNAVDGAWWGTGSIGLSKGINNTTLTPKGTNSSTGGGTGHTHTVGDTDSSSNLPPYEKAYCWKRIA